MLKSKFKFMLILLAIVALISTASFASEVSLDELLDQSTDGTEDVIIDEDSEVTDNSNEDEWVKSDLYKIDEKVVIDQVVDGNVYVIANEVVISSEIGGNVFVMADKINIDGGYIYNNLYALAKDEIVINGVVCDAYICASNFTLGENGYIYRDLRITSNNININGRIRRNAFMAGLNFNFSEEQSQLIGGNLEYSAKEEANIPEDAVVGDVIFNIQETKEVPVANIVRDYVFDLANMLIYALVVALLSLWLAPKFVERVSNMDVGKAFISFGIGAATLVVGLIAIFALIISSIASLVGVSALFIFIPMCLASTAFASLYFGSLFAKLLKWEDKTKFVIACVLSALAIWIIAHIPFIGPLLGFCIAVFGLGTLVVNIIVRKESKKEVTIDPTKDSKAE